MAYAEVLERHPEPAGRLERLGSGLAEEEPRWRRTRAEPDARGSPQED